MSEFPRNPEHQDARDTLAREVRTHRRERDTLRKESRSLLGKAKKFFGLKDAEALADEQHVIAEMTLANGKEKLEPWERKHRMTAFEHGDSIEQTSPDARRSKSIEETIYEMDSLKELYDAILDRWRQNKKGSRWLPKKLSERFALVNERRFLRGAKVSPVVIFELLSEYGCLRLNFWAVDAEKKQILLTHDIYTLGEDGKTRGKGQTAVRNTLELLQELSNKSGYSISEVIVTNEKSTPLILDDPSMHIIEEDFDTFARPFFDDKQQERKESFVSGLGHWDVRVKTYQPGDGPKSILPEDAHAIKEMMDRAGISSTIRNT